MKNINIRWFYSRIYGIGSRMYIFKSLSLLYYLYLKGIFVRNLRYLMDVNENIDLFQSEKQTYTKFLEKNVKALVSKASCMPESDDKLR